MKDQDIARALKVGTATVERVRRRCVEEGLARATKPRRSTCRLAFHHRRRPHQAQVLIPINTTLMAY